MAIPLVCEGRIGEAVRDHPSAPLQRRPDFRSEVVAPGREVQQGFGDAVPAMAVALHQKAADLLGPRASPWLAGRNDLQPARLECGQESCLLSGLSSPLASLKRYETAALAHGAMVAARGPGVNRCQRRQAPCG